LRTPSRQSTQVPPEHWPEAQSAPVAHAAPSAIPLGLDGQRKAPDTEGGMTAGAYGVARHLLPTTILIDRSGKIRAAGVKSDKAKALIEKFLAEEAR
jgi:hypothetical protein